MMVISTASSTRARVHVSILWQIPTPTLTPESKPMHRPDQALAAPNRATRAVAMAAQTTGVHGP